MKLQMISDPAHGWLRAPVALLFDLGIERKITQYSFVSPKNRWVYLEEDVDAETLISELHKRGILFTIVPQKKSSNNYSFVRKYPRFKLAYN